MLTSRNRQIAGVGVALLLFGGGVLLGHSTTSGSATAATRTTTTTNPTGTPTPAPASGAGLGASRVVSGIPVGYPDTRSGALSAAANYTAATGSPATLTASGRSAVLAAIAAPASATAVGSQLASASSSMLDQMRTDQASGTPFVFQTVPLALKVAGAYSPANVTVDVFAVGYLASSTTTAAEGYEQGTLQLAWTAGDWKLVSYNTTGSTTGPEPTGYNAPDSGWTPANGESLYQTSSDFRTAMGGSGEVVPSYVVP